MMRKIVGLAVALLTSAAIAQEVLPSPNGIELPQNYKDWRVMSVSERTDNNTLRIIIGNDTAIEAARARNTNPWPDGAILGKIVLEQENHEGLGHRHRSHGHEAGRVHGERFGALH